MILFHFKTNKKKLNFDGRMKINIKTKIKKEIKKLNKNINKSNKKY